MISQILDEVKSSKDELFIDLGSGKIIIVLAYCYPSNLTFFLTFAVDTELTAGAAWYSIECLYEWFVIRCQLK